MSPDKSQATGFRGESLNLIRAPSHMTQQTFDRIGTANGAMHDGREGIKRQQVLFIFSETADRFWVTLVVFAFESG